MWVCVCGARALTRTAAHQVLFFDTAHSTRSGLIDMGTVRDAVTTVVAANHAILAPNTTFKLSFTLNVIKTAAGGGAARSSAPLDTTTGASSVE
jgi:hypothetical protein